MVAPFLSVYFEGLKVVVYSFQPGYAIKNKVTVVYIGKFVYIYTTT
ncbi:hypothetical protein M133_3857 [Bacteroides fragilis str. S24L26]|nr:hypothetical protein M133_3857 [Bacteroides fragilis str. S24L26]EYA78658.1 hypothetical protein M134_3960 [Bacteroides fragilis str. S24L34]